MRISGAATAAALAIAVVVPIGVAVPAVAGTGAVTDPEGDAGGARRLDVTRAVVHNHDDRIVARVRFAKAVPGDLIVSIDPRGDEGVRLVATRRRDGSVRGRVLPAAFTDRSTAGGMTCDRLRVRWDEDVARLRLPSRCLQGGDYGAVRFAVLTENGPDSDFAPETTRGDVAASRWIPRG